MGGLLVLSGGMDGTGAAPSHDHSIRATFQAGSRVTVASTSRVPVEQAPSLKVMLGPKGVPGGHAQVVTLMVLNLL